MKTTYPSDVEKTSWERYKSAPRLGLKMRKVVQSLKELFLNNSQSH